MTPRVPMSLAVIFCGWMVCVLAASPVSARPLFDYPAARLGPEPYHVLTTDLDGDGALDLLSTLTDYGELRVVMGNGDGSFSEPAIYHVANGVGNRFRWATLGDFDNDGETDLAMAIMGNGEDLAVVLGNGDGTFQPVTHWGTGAQWHEQVAVGDFDDDGNQDLATDRGRILFGSGDGTFAPGVASGGGGNHVAVGDFNGDLFDDLAFTDGVLDAVEIFLSQGDGTFAPAGLVIVGDDPDYIVSADLDDDDALDLAVVVHSNDTVATVYGNGDGTFGDLRQYDPMGIDGNHIAIADIDDDGLPDLVVSNWTWVSTAMRTPVFLGTGNRGFASPFEADELTYVAGSVAIGDFDGDGRQDIAKPHWWRDLVGIRFGMGDGTFEPLPGLTEVGEFAVWPLVVDLNADGRLDLITVNLTSNDLSVLLGDGAGSFAPETRLTAGTNPTHFALGEVTGDGHPDLVVANIGSNDLSILAGNGDGTFDPPTSIPLANPNPRSPIFVALGDFDGDDRRDLVASIHGTTWIVVMLGNGDGTFGAQSYIETAAGTAGIVVGDFDGDEVPDIAVANSDADVVSILLGVGDGTFVGGQTITTFDNPYYLTTGDIDGDLELDLAVSYFGQGLVFLGSGNGTFSSPVQAGAGGRGSTLVDLNDDGRLDVLGGSAAGLRFGTDAGTFPPGSPAFEPPQFFIGLGHSTSTGDFDLDGRTDVVSVDTSKGVMILRNLPGPTALVFDDASTLAWPSTTGATSYDVYRGDLSALVDGDDDGLPDAGYGSCITGLDDDARDTFFVDPAIPAGDDGFFYLMESVDAGGPGGLGSTSAGLTRLPATPCP